MKMDRLGQRKVMAFAVRVLVPVITATVLATSSVAASRYNPLPIEQRDAVDTHYPSAQESVSQPSEAVSTPSRFAPEGSSTSSRTVAVNQPLVSGGEQWALYDQMQQMQDELQMLRGLLEQQAHELTQMKRQQRERYLDLDQRLGQMKSAVPSQEVAHSAATSDQVVTSLALSDVEQLKVDTQRYNAAFQLLKDRKYDEAVDAFKALLASSPSGGKAPYCEYWLGELYLVSDPADLDQAKTHFVTLLTQYPGHVKIPDGMFKLGTVFDRAGDKSKAVVTLKKVIKDHKGTQAAKLAESYLKRL